LFCRKGGACLEVLGIAHNKNNTLTGDIEFMMDAVLVAEPLLALVALLFFIIRPAFAPQALLLALAPWVVRLFKHGRLTRYTLFDLPLALFLGSALLGVWAAYDTQAAWQKFWLIVGGVVLYFRHPEWPPVLETLGRCAEQ